jgi:hypothetical protein
MGGPSLISEPKDSYSHDIVRHLLYSRAVSFGSAPCPFSFELHNCQEPDRRSLSISEVIASQCAAEMIPTFCLRWLSNWS